MALKHLLKHLQLIILRKKEHSQIGMNSKQMLEKELIIKEQVNTLGKLRMLKRQIHQTLIN
jgi:hypothetical protein